MGVWRPRSKDLKCQPSWNHTKSASPSLKDDCLWSPLVSSAPVLSFLQDSWNPAVPLVSWEHHYPQLLRLQSKTFGSMTCLVFSIQAYEAWASLACSRASLLINVEAALLTKGIPNRCSMITLTSSHQHISNRKWNEIPLILLHCSSISTV